MYLKNLKLTNFRNYKQVVFEFSPQINVLIGKNAQGKTNLLESIYFLAMASSHRNAKDKNLITFDQKFMRVLGKIVKKNQNLSLEIGLNLKGKQAKVNRLERKKLSQYVGNLNVILFAPEDLALIKGSPKERRRFIDMEFSQIDPIYLYNLTQYKSFLKQRNSYLKKISKRDLYLDVLSEQLAIWGEKIVKQRKKYLNELQKYAKVIHNQITNDVDNFDFVYSGSLDLVEDLRKNLEKDLIFKTTSAGPHRDDILFLVDGKNVQIYGSQGQQRTVALATKLAEIDLMHNKTGEYPILLLDDVLSELDSFRQTHLLKAIQNKVQTFLTTTSLSDVTKSLIKEPKVFRIEKGTIQESYPQETTSSVDKEG